MKRGRESPASVRTAAMARSSTLSWRRASRWQQRRGVSAVAVSTRIYQAQPSSRAEAGRPVVHRCSSVRNIFCCRDTGANVEELPLKQNPTAHSYLLWGTGWVPDAYRTSSGTPAPVPHLARRPWLSVALSPTTTMYSPPRPPSPPSSRTRLVDFLRCSGLSVTVNAPWNSMRPPASRTLPVASAPRGLGQPATTCAGGRERMRGTGRCVARAG